MATTGYVVLLTHAALDMVSLGLIYLFHRRRNYQPIRSRFWWQGEFTAGSLLIAMASAACAIEFANHISCEVYLLIILAIFNALIPILIRIAHVFSAYEVSKIYAQNMSSNAENKALSGGSIFLRRAELLQSLKVQGVVQASIVTLHVIVWVLYTQVFRTTCDGIDELIGILLFGSAYMCLTFYLSWNIATLKDGLYIRREMLLVALGGTLMLIAFMTLRIIYGTFYYANFALAFGPFWMIAAQIGLPLYKSYTWMYNNDRISELDTSFGESSLASLKSNEKLQKRERKNGGPVISTEGEKPDSVGAFRRLLASEEGYELFLEYSRLELSHENVLFYHEVTPLLDNTKQRPEVVNSEAFGEIAFGIYDKFVRQDAKLEVNLSSTQRAKFKAAGFEEGPEGLNTVAALEAIQDAWKAVFALMFRDTFWRFRGSENYKEYLAMNV